MPMTPLHHSPPALVSAAIALLDPDRCLDPKVTIPQKAISPVHQLAETCIVPDRLSLNIWCPATHQARLETVLAPFAEVLTPHITDDADIAALTTDANEPSLIFFDGLSDALAAALGDQRDDPESKTASPPVLPRPLSAIVDDWTAQSEALLALVERSRTPITLAPAAALLDRPEALQQALSTRYSLPFEAQPDQIASDIVPIGQPPHFALMASAMAQTSPQVAPLLDRLTKASLPVDGVDLQRHQTPAMMQRLLIEADALHRAERDEMKRAHDRDLRRVEGLAEATIQRLRHQADTARLALLERDALSNRLSEEAAQNDAAATYLKEELTRRETTYTAQTTEIDMLRATARQLEDIRRATSRKGNRLEQDLDKLTRNIQMRDGRIQALAEALHGYEDEALALREEVGALRRSTSWRLTAPVRGVSLVVRKFLRR